MNQDVYKAVISIASIMLNLTSEIISLGCVGVCVCSVCRGGFLKHFDMDQLI